MSSFLVIKIFVLRIIVFKNYLQKYKIYLVLKLVFMILKLFLQIIYVDRLIFSNLL